jgi:tRNA (Thr-GGU) A37 N-methylase
VLDYVVRPIGVVRASRSAAIDDDWDDVDSAIDLDPAVVGRDAPLGLDEFSHVEVIYLFHLVESARERVIRVVELTGR